jgi:outer membrane lipoprotein-sorting protein
MKFIRTVSTGRLLASIVGLAVAIAAGTAIAVAASGPGPVPAKQGLASAAHRALGAAPVTGITADISFTNHLIDSSDFTGQSVDPILQGATGRLWLSNDHRLRLELQSDNGDAQVVVNQRSFWISDPSSHTVYEGTLPADKAGAKPKSADHGVPTVAELQRDLNKLRKQVNVSGAIPSDVAGQSAYTVSVSPKHDGGLLGQAQLAWDAVKGVPLRVAVYAKNNTSPVLELKATNIAYGQVSPSTFNVTPPAGSKVVKISSARTAASHAKAARIAKAGQRGIRAHHQVSGVAAVAGRLPFKLVAPDKLVGLPRQSVQLLDWGGKPAAAVSYGQNTGAIAVIEQTADAGKASVGPAGGGNGRGLSLPTISIHGATGQELDTALGTMVRFTRGGVAYTVIGSVPSTAADAAARGL